MSLTIAMLGYYGYDNLGDEAVLEGIIFALKQSAAKKNEDLSIIVLSADPDTTCKRCNCGATDRKSIKNVFMALYRCDALIVGGGSLFQDTTRLGLTPSYYAGVSLLAKILGKKVIFYAQGIGPLKRSINKALTAFSACMTDILSVRDNVSLLELRNLGVNAKSIHLTADPAFALLPDKDSCILREVLKKLPDKPILGIMLRGWPGIEDILERVAMACETLAKELGLCIALVPMQKEQDLEVCRKLSLILNTESFIIDDDLSAAEMIALFGRFNLVIAMRLHALIFASIAGVPMIGIGYDPKVNSFLAHMGTGLSSDTALVSGKDLAEQGFKLWNDRVDIRERLFEKSKGLREESFAFAQMVIETLMGGR